MDKKTYTIHKNPEAAAVDYVASYVYSKEYTPQTAFKVWYEEGKGFHLHMRCDESNPKAVYHNPMDSVFKDSCMEWFISFYPQLPYANYINFEMNANGAMLINYHEVKDGENVTYECIELFNGTLKPTVEADYWTLDLFVPLTFIQKVYQTDQVPQGALRGNVYKCGDETAIEHYGTWNPSGNPYPNFHLPEYFGTFIMED